MPIALKIPISCIFSLILMINETKIKKKVNIMEIVAITTKKSSIYSNPYDKLSRI